MIQANPAKRVGGTRSIAFGIIRANQLSSPAAASTKPASRIHLGNNPAKPAVTEIPATKRPKGTEKPEPPSGRASIECLVSFPALGQGAIRHHPQHRTGSHHIESCREAAECADIRFCRAYAMETQPADHRGCEYAKWNRGAELQEAILKPQSRQRNCRVYDGDDSR
jgi:hypothetical protein